mmetsp:Transcript_11326/g.26076  ORF Transcript_11326/g.26076 Transcript_11326/m.26076 type:complete len:217 (+) Transcript_11326:558-1208(+)
MIAIQLVSIPKKKPVAGRKIVRLKASRLLKAISWIRPHTKPSTAPLRSMKRNSLFPSFWKKWLRSSFFSVKTLTIMPSLSIPYSGLQRWPEISRHSSGEVSSILSTAASATRVRKPAGNLRSVLGKCTAPARESASLMTFFKWLRVRLTRAFASTLSSHTRGGSRYGLAHLYEMRAIFWAFLGMTPCQPMPIPDEPCCHNPMNSTGLNIIWIASQM